MNWMFIYKLVLGVGVLVLLSSLFFPLTIFMILLSVGVIISCFALFEMYLLHKEHITRKIPSLPATPPGALSGKSDVSYFEAPLTRQAVAHTMSPRTSSFFSSLVHRVLDWKHALLTHPQKIEVAAIKGKKEQPQKNTPPQDIQVIAPKETQAGEDATKFTSLRAFIMHSLRQGFPEEKIREAVFQAHWPEELYRRASRSARWQLRKKKLLYSSLIFLASLVYTVILYVQGLFLIPYWITLLKYASPLVYVGLSLILFAGATLILFNLKKTLKKRKVTYTAVEEQHVEQIKSTLASFAGRYETDLDKLYALLQERKTLRLNEVARAFGISKEEAEEWGKILRDQGLAEIYYPTVGDMEIRWKK